MKHNNQKKHPARGNVGDKIETPAFCKKSGNTAIFELLLMDTAKKLGLKIEKEYKFLPNRRFRFDFADPDLKLAWEFEGILSAKSRHTTITGYTNDCRKYNLAALNGWKVFRYTTLNMGEVVDDLRSM